MHYLGFFRLSAFSLLYSLLKGGKLFIRIYPVELCRQEDYRFKQKHYIYARKIMVINKKLNMTEKEKMLAGISYDCGDKELQTRWHLAKKLTRAYYETDTTDRDKLNEILDQLLGSRGENVWVAAPLHVDYGENIHLGNNIEINMNCTFLDCNKITIGDNSGIGPNVQIFAVGHPVNPEERLTQTEKEGFPFWKSHTAPVTIGKNVWIGGGTIILPGVTIGDNTTIGAGSVVTKSIPANCLAVGNPCKVVRYL